MARFALIKGGVVASVIVAEPAFFERADPRWRAQFDSFVNVDEARDCEPGSLFDGDRFERVARVETPTEIEAIRADLEAVKAQIAAKAVR